MKTTISLVLYFFVVSLHADYFMNKCTDGRVFVVTIPNLVKKSRAVTIPPTPPGMESMVPIKVNRVESKALQIKVVQAIPLKDLFVTNATTQTIVGRQPLLVKKAEKGFKVAGTVPITQPTSPPAIITSELNQPVYFPNGEVVLCHVTNVKVVQLAGYDCKIVYTVDFQSFGESGDFYQSPVDRIVEVNLIIPMDQDWPQVFWQGMNYHR